MLCIDSKSFLNSIRLSGILIAIESRSDNSLDFFSFHTLELNCIISWVVSSKMLFFSFSSFCGFTCFSKCMLVLCYYSYSYHHHYPEYSVCQRYSVINGVIGAKSLRIAASTLCNVYTAASLCLSVTPSPYARFLTISI